MSEPRHCPGCKGTVEFKGNFGNREIALGDDPCPGCPACIKKDARIAALEAMQTGGGCAYCTFVTPETTFRELQHHIEHECAYHPLRKRIAALEDDLAAVANELRILLKRHPAGCDCVMCQVLTRPGVLAVLDR